MNFSELEFSPPAISEPDSRPDATPLFHRRLFWLLSVAGVVLFTGTWLLAQGRQGSPFPGPQPSFGDLTAAPPNVVLNTPTTVTLTIRIDSPTLNPTTVQLQRVDVDGTFVAAIGRMYDNGKEGDVKAGDRIFTARVALNESEVGSLYFRVAAAFRGNRQNAMSDVQHIDIWQTVSDPSTGVALSVPPDWVAEAGAAGLRIQNYSPPSEPGRDGISAGHEFVEIFSLLESTALADYAGHVMNPESLVVDGHQAIRGLRATNELSPLPGYDMYIATGAELLVVLGTFDGKSATSVNTIRAIQDSLTFARRE